MTVSAGQGPRANAGTTRAMYMSSVVHNVAFPKSEKQGVAVLGRRMLTGLL